LRDFYWESSAPLVLEVTAGGFDGVVATVFEPLAELPDWDPLPELLD
jgi:hypothetical protein